MVAPLLGSMVIFGSVIVSRSAALVTVAQSFADGPMYAFTAARVFGPNLPSAPPLGQYPLPQRKSCTHLTSSPVEPSLRGVFTGLFGLDKSVVAGGVGGRGGFPFWGGGGGGAVSFCPGGDVQIVPHLRKRPQRLRPKNPVYLPHLGIAGGSEHFLHLLQLCLAQRGDVRAVLACGAVESWGDELEAVSLDVELIVCGGGHGIGGGGSSLEAQGDIILFRVYAPGVVIEEELPAPGNDKVSCHPLVDFSAALQPDSRR